MTTVQLTRLVPPSMLSWTNHDEFNKGLKLPPQNMWVHGEPTLQIHTVLNWVPKLLEIHYIYYRGKPCIKKKLREIHISGAVSNNGNSPIKRKVAKIP